MARAVYSSQFIVYTEETPNLAYAVPEGYTAVVRDFESYQTVGSYYVILGFQNSPEAPNCGCVALQATGANNRANWSGRLVVPGGGIINLGFSTILDSLNAYVGGYLLRNDP